MNASTPGPPVPAANRVGRLSEAVVAHPLRALVLTAVSAAAVAVAMSGALRSGQSASPHTSSSSFVWPGLARSAYGTTNVGQAMGRALAGRAPETETLAQAEAQANALPAGAIVDRATNTIRFTGTSASIAIVANPPNGTDMRFRAAGLENPTIDVARGAVVKIHFVNADSDSAHGWLLLDPVVRIGNTVHGPRAFPDAFALLGDPTSTGQPATTITFRASRTGTYRYECPVPHHAAMSMQGTFVVNA